MIRRVFERRHAFRLGVRVDVGQRFQLQVTMMPVFMFDSHSNEQKNELFVNIFSGVSDFQASMCVFIKRYSNIYIHLCITLG